MAERQAEVGTAMRNMAVFLSWALTSFLCHWCAKAFLSSIKVEIQSQQDTEAKSLQFRHNLLGASLVTLVQMVLCYLCVNMNNNKARNFLNVARVTHVLATFATNISMAMMFASSTFAIKLMEPITSAVTQYCIIRTPLTPVAMASLPIIVGGAIAFSGNPLTDTSLSVGVGVAFASNIILAIRNLAIKRMDEDDKPVLTLNIRLSQMPLIASSMLGCSGLLLYLEKLDILPPAAPYIIAMCFLSGVFHVVYSYVSTGMVLKQLSVVSHAVANIMKRVLVVLLLYLGGTRQASLQNFLGLLVCVAGLFLYAWDKRSREQKNNTGSGNGAFSAISAGSSVTVLGRRALLTLGTACLALFTCVTAFYGVPTAVPALRGLARELHTPTMMDAIPSRNFGPNSGFTRELQTPTMMDAIPSRSFGPNSSFTRELQTPTMMDAISSWSFGPNSLKRPSWKDLEPDISGYLVNDSLEIVDFLQKRLIHKSEESNFISNKLRTSFEVIKETQRIHYNMFGDALGKFKYCMLIDTADFENKGDPAITAGEIYYLARNGLQIVYYCNTQMCSEAHIDRAAELAKKFSKDDLVILVQGGGNIDKYVEHDKIRFSTMEKFVGFQIFVFPQSIRLENPRSEHWAKCQKLYCCNRNLTLVLRDLGSLDIARRYFNGSTRLLMAPDMVFHIGPVKRFVSPAFDIMWVRRTDSETAGYKTIPRHPPHLRLHVSDWKEFRTPNSDNSLEKSFHTQVMGLFFIQRGRVVITDRLHGHILATLLDIPHVLLDNKHRKLSNYFRTWNKGLQNVRVTDNAEEALAMALELLEIYKDTLPPRLPFMQISPAFENINFTVPEMNYP
ncbi:triose phosphate/phosphate translocator, chloroplastic [Plakobranchus ocellatus]|uniref:Triose phosphate/phosphate translocator, chloroplastic n=1 Tax=Plakobranchus ocellatus TaxID=259542 RepID=A0AAV3Z9B8_9GAST|nr:triose phosphate/phosphate translocator, chloroplastic [Plakobranchus ocellatus]